MLKRWFVLFFIFFLGITPKVVADCKGEIMKSRSTGLPVLTDFNLQAVEQAVRESLAYYEKKPSSPINVCGHLRTLVQQIEELNFFLSLIQQGGSEKDVWQRIRQTFDFCQAVGPRERLLVTGYYEPVFSGSLHKTEKYAYPLYKMPTNLVLPYFSRAQIENQDILAGGELVYLQDPFEAFLFHIQGSGKIRLADGSLRLIRYCGNNGWKYTSIGRVLVDQGKMALAEVDLSTIKAYLHGHPGEVREILQHNERFIFFSMSDPVEGTVSSQPTGSLGRPLTPGVSVALDQSSYPAGALAFLVGEFPEFGLDGQRTGWRPMARFVLNQDSGSAIKGLGRVDLFLGFGIQAEMAAGVMKQTGKLYFLLKKEGE